MLPPPTLPLSGHCGLSQNATVGSTGALLSGRDWPRYLSGCSLGPLSTTSPFALPRFPGVLSVTTGPLQNSRGPSAPCCSTPLLRPLESPKRSEDELNRPQESRATAQ